MTCNVTMDKITPGHIVVIIKKICDDQKSILCQKTQMLISVSDQNMDRDSRHQHDHIVAVIIGALLGIILVATFLMFLVKKCTFARKLQNEDLAVKNNCVLPPCKEQTVLLISYSNPQQSKMDLYYFSEILRENSIKVINIWDKNTQKNIMESQFDWLEKCVDCCNHFLFVYNRGLFKSLKTLGFHNDQKDKEIGHCDHITNLLTYLFVLLRQKITENKHCYVVSFGYVDGFPENVNFDQTHINSSYINSSYYDLIETVRTGGRLKAVSLDTESWSKFIGNILSVENYTPDLHTVNCTYFLAAVTDLLSEHQNEDSLETQTV
ncbi:hypothetical protein KUTeg_020175 [Tegillarca granosa]|uniref:SEFIR domain-containing protein n=1 Tax=Tegillarca granosa TaxID=220873 RepID=A0ABQ9E721_TEGGR|nr:hypothetical protein KUTeg_020175 [Tegillarca granosa]